MRAGKRPWFVAGWLPLSGCLLLVFCGCSPSEPSVSGTVFVDGTPLPMGSITFVPMEGTLGPGGGSAIDEGKYRIDKGLRVGEYRVQIQGIRPGPRKVQDPLAPTRLIPDA